MADLLGRLGASDATLGRATRHLLLSPSDPVDSEAALRATDAYLLLGWEGVQRLALGLLIERRAMLAAVPTDGMSYLPLLTLVEVSSAELDRVVARAFGTATIGAVSAQPLP